MDTEIYELNTDSDTLGDMEPSNDQAGVRHFGLTRRIFHSNQLSAELRNRFGLMSRLAFVMLCSCNMQSFCAGSTVPATILPLLGRPTKLFFLLHETNSTRPRWSHHYFKNEDYGKITDSTCYEA